MADLRKHSSTSNIIRLVLKHATTGVGLTGLSSASTGLIISTIADNEATATAYTVAGSTVETITTLGTFAAPTATKCRFKEVDATNHKGLYELQFADARFSVASAKRFIVSLTGATNLLDADYEIQLVQFDPYAALATPTNITAATGIVLSGVTHAGAVIPTVTTLTGHTAQTGDAYARLGAPAGASVSEDVAAVKVDTAAILVDTAEIGAAGAGLTALATQASATAIKAKTDSLTFTVAGQVDANVQSVNDVTIV